MLLVKTRFTAAKATEGAIEETKEVTTDASTSMITESTSMDGQAVTMMSDDDKNVTSNVTESNEISTNELETAPAVNLGEKPIVIEKRNDPRFGLNIATTPTLTAPSFISSEAASPSTTEEATSTVSNESSVSEISTTDSPSETSQTSESSSSEVATASTTAQPEKTAEKLIESAAIVTPIAIELTTLKALEIPTTVKAPKSTTTQMTNDVILNDSPSHESSEEDGSHEEDLEHHQKNNFNGDDEEPYRPNRHRGQIGQHQRSGLKTKLGKIIG